MQEDLRNQKNENQSEVSKILKELAVIHTRIEKWLRFFAQSELEKRLSNIFSTNEELIIYELTNGKRSSREIAKLVNKSHNWIVDLWKKWEDDNNIVEPIGPRKPYSAKYTLPELAILFGKSELKEG
ncbi:MAG: hypothetical protein FVQ83_07210 [Chloroflexi bacterium]|nr:hypothetical protein [Chloroflexota bacterium]